ncbi:MAG: hypothetical protein KGI50_06435 [Patescibacteria group bacterium]|nr:hypothetical protein [Patescibacteria group bacterium]MDE2439129.1 hypothetical protein [Patescibacteria group bacterium]
MFREAKKIYFVGSATVTTGQTISFPNTNGEDLANAIYRYSDILVNLKTLSGGTTPGITISYQELFSDNSGSDLWVETGNSGSKTTAAKFFLTNGDSSGHTGDVGKNAAMGSGMAKRIVTTLTGSPTGVSADFYIILYN